eukprot:EG_transcript_3058
MRLSVYTIYVTACLMAIGAAILSGVILLDTFHGQQHNSEQAQITAGRGQVQAMQGIIQNRMARMETITEEHSRQLIMFIQTLPSDGLLPVNAISSLNQTIFSDWVPSVRANNSLNGYGITCMYVNETTGDHYDRTFWVYWDLLTTGEYVYVYAYTLPEDRMTHAYRTVWLNYSTAVLADDMYYFDTNAIAANVYKNDDFFDVAQPWVSADGNLYWYFTHMRSFQYRGVWLNFQSWDVGLCWLDLMKNVLTPEANLVAFDSQAYVMAASNPDEIKRLAACRGDFNSGAVTAACISHPAGSHPNTEIRNLYNALATPAWTDLTAAPIPLQQVDVLLAGRRYMAIFATLFSKDHFRTTIVWDQPWVVSDANAVGLTTLICILTMLSTFVLTLLGVFGVLRPLMALGNAMRVVAHTLKEGDGENEAVLEPRKPNVFREVDEIGQDFETIVVDFLGFSHANARDNKHAPKDPAVPFAVIFTDIQSSTGLWARDPEEMSRCIQIHHELIRQLIKKHALYEVKTVGDSFMVTTTSVDRAALFTLDVQTTLFEYDWEWPGLDQFYRETTLMFAKSPDGPFATEDDYRDLWNGLRVRIGIHYGMGEVTYDEVSKGYDYYGNVVNAAARIEALAHGGQIVVSDALLAALPTPLDPTFATVAPLGVFPLRGVADPPALAEVRPVALQDRSFPPLRFERANAEMKVESVAASALDGGYGVSLGADHHSHSDGRSSRRRAPSQTSEPPLAHLAEELAHGHALVRSGAVPLEALTQQLLTMYHVVDHLLMPLAPPQFTAVAKALAKGWDVPAPRAKADFGASGLRLVQRMAENTKVLTHFPQPQQRTSRSRQVDYDHLEVEIL